MSRRENDYYPTPTWQTDHLMSRLWQAVTLDRNDPLILEPCVGEGHLVRAAQQWVPEARWATNDIEWLFKADKHMDAATDGYWMGISEQRCDWVITNPPFNAAAEILPRALKHARCGVAALLRITFLEPTKDRGLFLRDNPPKWELVMERHSYRNNGAVDSVPCAWFVWGKDLAPRIEVIPGRGVQPDLLELVAPA